MEEIKDEYICKECGCHTGPVKFCPECGCLILTDKPSDVSTDVKSPSLPGISAFSKPIAPVTPAKGSAKLQCSDPVVPSTLIALYGSVSFSPVAGSEYDSIGLYRSNEDDSYHISIFSKKSHSPESHKMIKVSNQAMADVTDLLNSTAFPSLAATGNADDIIPDGSLGSEQYVRFLMDNGKYAVFTFRTIAPENRASFAKLRSLLNQYAEGVLR